MDPYNWQESQGRERQNASRTPTAPVTGLRFPLKEQYLRMFDQPHSSAHIQRLARAYEALPQPQQRQPSSSSQALDSLSTGLYGSLPSAGHGFSMSPQSYGPWTTEPSSLGADGMAMYRASMEAVAAQRSQSGTDRPRVPNPQSGSLPRTSVGWPLDIPERASSDRTTSKMAFSTSLPERAMSDQPMYRPAKRSSSLDVPQHSQSSSNLFGTHPSGDPAYFTAGAPKARSMSTSMAPYKPSKSPKRPPVRLSKVVEKSSEASENQSSSSSSSSDRHHRSTTNRRASGKKSTRSRGKTKQRRRTSASHSVVTAYTILGVDPACSQAKLRQVFRTLTDKLDEMAKVATTQAQSTAVQEKNMEIRKAYASVSDRKLRAKYDRWLDGSSPSATSSEDDKRQTTKEKSLYDILSIDNKATTEEIKDAAQAAIDYYNSVKEDAMNDAEFFAARKAMDTCQRAWRTLGNVKLREEYDRKLKYGSDDGSEEEVHARKSKPAKKDKPGETHSRETSRPSSLKQESLAGGKAKSSRRRSSRKYSSESDSSTSDGKNKRSSKHKGKGRAKDRRH